MEKNTGEHSSVETKENVGFKAKNEARERWRVYSTTSDLQTIKNSEKSEDRTYELYEQTKESVIKSVSEQSSEETKENGGSWRRKRRKTTFAKVNRKWA